MQDIVIGTPGRLKDLIEMRVCILKEVSFVVSRYSIATVYVINDWLFPDGLFVFCSFIAKEAEVVSLLDFCS